MEKTTVFLGKCTHYELDDVIDVIEDAWKAIGGLSSHIKKDDKVLLKPNMIFGMKPEQMATTHPVFIEAMVIVLQKHGIKHLSLGDSPGTGQKTEDILTICGYDTLCKKHNIKVANLVTEYTVMNEDAQYMKKFIIADELKQFDKIINLPKLKTHVLAMMTGAVKNYFGLIPGTHKHAYHFKMQDHLDFSASLLDLQATLEKMAPSISFMDGIIGMEGNGPTAGHPKKFGVVLASKSPIALDTVAEIVSGIKDVTTTIVAKERKMPESDIKNITVAGNTIEECKVTGTKMPFTLAKIVPKFIYRYLKNIFLRIPVVDADPCISCGRCADICPVHAIEMKTTNYKRRDKRVPVYDYKKCIRCYCCQELCPAKAIYLKKPFLTRIFFPRK